MEGVREVSYEEDKGTQPMPRPLYPSAARLTRPAVRWRVSLQEV
jgi:hypothetical protein